MTVPMQQQLKENIHSMPENIRISKSISIDEQPSTSAAVKDSSVSSYLPPRKKSNSKRHAKEELLVDPKHQMCQKLIKKLTGKLEKVNSKYKLQANQIRAARNVSKNKSFLQALEQLPNNIKMFTKLQLKWAKKPQGRRFTKEEKIMCLSILKQGPKAYNFLKKVFVLPSKRSLQKVLSSFTLKPGLNKNILTELKNVARNTKSEENKLVNLLFDEVSLEPGFYYNSKQDEIIGFEDYGFKKTKILADHALVFMIKGIKTKTKQPVCFTFCKGTTKKKELKYLIKNIIKEINECGLLVVGVICDQAQSNVSAIKSLREETKEEYLKSGKDYHSNFIEISKNKIFPLFDPPHLLKGVRNNLLNKDAIFVQNGKTKCAKWVHIEMLFDADEGADELRLIKSLTENHIKKDKIPKMRVKYAAQVFSQKVSGALRFAAKHKILPEECVDTADFLLIFDQLFDSFNGHSYQTTVKRYKCCLKNNSPHFQLWNDLLPILESIKFKSIRRNGSIKLEMIPSIKNWIHNIKSFREMWQYLNKNHNIYNLITRNFNQDPLENFFSGIRSNGVRNINPTCYQFINAYKTLIVNNFNSPHSARANCEEDNNKTMNSFSNLFELPEVACPEVDFACDIGNLLGLMFEIRTNESILHVETKKYVSGYIIKKCKTKIFKKCKTCMSDLCRPQVDLASYNYEADYTKRSLFHPSDSFVDLMSDVYFLTAACMRDWPESLLLKKKIISLINCACTYNVITCQDHKTDLISLINEISVNIVVHSWCTSVNKILHGELTKFHENDLIKKQAYNYYRTRQK